jgi:O-antigen/teichoic acid export membrane protein
VGYYKDALKGISWMGALRGSTRAIAYARIAILARLLTPAQFGIYGIASLVLAFLEIITETGINVFLVQDEGEIKNYLNTAWVVSIFRGILISALIIALAPLIASFFNSPEARNIIYLISLVPFIRGFINPSIVQFQKELEFNKEFWFRFVTFSTNTIVAVVVGYITKSAASLVWGLVAAASLEVAISFVLITPRPRIAFEGDKLKKVISRGKWLTAAGLFDYLFSQGDDIVVGKLLDTGSLGLYSVAYKASTLPVTEIGEVFNKVTFPVYTKILGDTKRLKKAFLKILGTTSLLVVPFGLVLFIFSRELVLILLGEQWIAADVVVKILAIFGVSRSLVKTANPLFLAAKKQEYVTLVNFLSIIGMAVTIVPFIHLYGVVGAAWASVVGVILSIPLVVYLSLKLLRS